MEGKEGSKKKVMVAIDETESSYHVLIWVLKNLKESVAKSQLVIFAAQPPPPCHSGFAGSLGFARLYSPFSAGPALIRSAQEQNKKVSLGILEKAKRICARQGIIAETVTEAGDPKEAICRAVQKYQIDLLVTGDQYHGILKRVYQGSISSYYSKSAKCPVLVLEKEG